MQKLTPRVKFRLLPFDEEVKNKGIFTNQSNMYDVAFLQATVSD